MSRQSFTVGQGQTIICH